jgi:hypothetical protein
MIIFPFPGEPSEEEKSESDGQENEDEDRPLDTRIYGRIPGDFLMGGSGEQPNGEGSQGHPYPTGQSFDRIH